MKSNKLIKILIFYSCEAMFLNAPLKSDEILSKTILYSISRAWRIGHAVLLARCKKSSPIDAILSVTNGKLLCRGKVFLEVMNLAAITCL